MKKTIIILAVASIVGMSATLVNTKDDQFVTEAAQAGLLEVQLGKLAMTNASSAEVKKLGEHMVTDHTKANNELKALAAKKSIKLPESLSADGKGNYESLSKKKGAEFDKAYAALMVADHEKVIALFKKEAESGNDADFKIWAKNTLPTLEHHLMMSKETHDKVK